MAIEAAKKLAHEIVGFIHPLITHPELELAITPLLNAALFDAAGGRPVPAAENSCKPGAWCPGMRSLLEATVRGGMEQAIVPKRTIIHRAIVDDKKAWMHFNFCPCCGADIRSKEKA